jgi:hypothetical protein
MVAVQAVISDELFGPIAQKRVGEGIGEDRGRGVDDQMRRACGRRGDRGFMERQFK